MYEKKTPTNRQVSINFFLTDEEWHYFRPVILESIKGFEFSGDVFFSEPSVDQEQLEVIIDNCRKSCERAIQDLENQKYIATKIELISMRSKFNLICNGSKK